MNDKLELIRKKCIEANPEIVELKFGCEVVLNLNNDKAVLLGETSSFLSGWFKTNNEIYPVGGHTFEIIGRPIRLADVIFAISKNWVRDNSDKSRLMGTFVFFSDQQSKLLCTVSLWNLLKDNLEDQSEETISFIYDLLK